MAALSSRPFRHASAAVWLTAAVFVWACHDAHRSNPMDPVLTPPVTLTAVLDDTAGTVTLTWSRYLGDQPFAAYRVLRNAQRSTEVDTIATIAAPVDTHWIDATLKPGTAYEYRVETANRSGYRAVSANCAVAGYTLGEVVCLAAEPDTLVGAVRLRWTRYIGPGFQAYEVIRRVAETVSEERLARIAAVGDTTLTDSTAQADVPYVYTVRLDAVGLGPRCAPLEARLTLPAVRLVAHQFASTTATAALRWTRYRGPRFAEYRVIRKTGEMYGAGESSQVVHATTVATDTAFTDSLLAGATRYSYEVAVTTTRSESVISAAATGAFHEPLTSWALPMADGGCVRLYWEDGNLEALVADPDGVRLLRFDRGGRQLGSRALLDWPASPAKMAGHRRTLRSVSMAPLADGTHLLSLVGPGDGEAAVLALQANGDPLWREPETVFQEPVAGPAAALPLYSGGWQLGVEQVENLYHDRFPGLALLNAAEVTVDGRSLLDPEPFAQDRWDTWPSSAVPVAGGVRLEAHDLANAAAVQSMSRQVVSAWRDARLQADFSSAGGIVAVSIGPQDPVYTDQVTLRVPFTDATTIAIVRRRRDAAFPKTGRVSTTNATLSFPLLRAVPYRVWARRDSSSCGVALSHPMYYHEPCSAGTEYLSLASTANQVFLVTGSAPTLLGGGGPMRQTDVGGQVSEVRAWRPGNQGAWVGVCVPEEHRVSVGYARWSDRATWPLNGKSDTRLGLGVGQGPGELRFPVSFAPGPDDRIFVLDAGNARIAVFSRTGRPITQWGSHGANPGQFHFGAGYSGTGYAGSIAVDDQGFIYVADPGNGRIQKFAP